MFDALSDRLEGIFGRLRSRGRLSDGLVITIEPIIAAGKGKVSLQPDQWTVTTDDRSLTAHYEHTIVITRGAPIVLTAAA